MPDPDAMTPEEYKKHADAQWAKALPGKLEGVDPPKPKLECFCGAFPGQSPKSQGESMSEFKPGQTVWPTKRGGRPQTVIAQDGDLLWLKEESGHREVWHVSYGWAATDPNAEPAPQACPFCGGAPSFVGEGSFVRVHCGDFCLMSPAMPRLEAIQVWNRISLRGE